MESTPVADSLGPAGMKPTEAKKGSMTLCEPTVGLARLRRNLQLQSAFVLRIGFRRARAQ